MSLLFPASASPSVGSVGSPPKGAEAISFGSETLSSSSFSKMCALSVSGLPSCSCKKAALPISLFSSRQGCEITESSSICLSSSSLPCKIAKFLSSILSSMRGCEISIISSFCSSSTVDKLLLTFLCSSMEGCEISIISSFCSSSKVNKLLSTFSCSSSWGCEISIFSSSSCKVGNLL
uniref:Uncharacterized protein n=1 Tax=Opuntia streptacantha TaxID=393608 RepID=A0A7C9F0A6_OPUST